MTTLEGRDGRVKDLGEGFSAERGSEPARTGSDQQGLVLPQEVVADLAAELVARARAGQPVKLTGADGLLAKVIGQVLQAGLGVELEEHLRGGGQQGNGRNGYSAKTVNTEAGPVRLAVPRDRAGTFEPVLVPKGARRTSGISDTVVSLYGGGMSVRDIARHCQRTMGIEISHDTISKICECVV